MKLLNWFADLSVRVKILCVAGLGMGVFLAYFLYSYVIAERNIGDLQQIEQQDFVLLEAASQNNIALFSARDALVRAITSGDPESLDDATRLAGQASQNMQAMVDVDPRLAEDIDELIGAFRAYFEAGSALAKAQIDGAVTDEAFYDQLANVAQLRDAFEVLQEDFQEAR